MRSAAHTCTSNLNEMACFVSSTATFPGTPSETRKSIRICTWRNTEFHSSFDPSHTETMEDQLANPFPLFVSSVILAGEFAF